MDFHEQLSKIGGGGPVGDGTIDAEFAARSRRDPGSPPSAMLALVVIFVLYGLIVAGNVMPTGGGGPEPQETVSAEWTEQEREEYFERTRRDPMAAVARLMMYVKEEFGPQLMSRSVSEDQLPPESDDPMLQYQRVVMAGELLSAERALEEIERIERIRAADADGNGQGGRERAGADEEPGAEPVGQEQALEYLRRVYEGTLAGDSLGQDMADGEDYLGWWAKLARLHDAGADHPERADILDAGRRLFGFAMVVMSGVLLVGSAALAASIYMIVRLSRRSIQTRFIPPAPGGSVYLEIFAVFLAGFLVVQILGILVASMVSTEAALWASLFGQWALILVPLWPLVRGVPLSRMREDLGLHGGEGLVREVGAGIVGYLAGLPIFIGALIFMFILQAFVQLLSGSPDPVQPNNPVLDLVQTQSIPIIVLTVSLAVLWAPIVEETVFRGALLRHVRGRVGVLVGAILTGILFAFLHSYGALFTPPLIALGFTFAMLREWRGSLIAPITAHFLHNATLMAIIITGLSIVG